MLYLNGNQIRNIDPLITNNKKNGLGEGDYINLKHNLLNLSEGSKTRTEIYTLINNGVELEFKPQKGSQQQIQEKGEQYSDVEKTGCFITISLSVEGQEFSEN